ncbi:hypothetical protein SAMN05216405_1671 [Lachnospiraceae bacterium NLAE-zl-G231]|nr:hypothetical protein SAMN05216405_1671 [Lachnospiraceae bacterium NLAE-zl-G231]
MLLNADERYCYFLIFTYFYFCNQNINVIVYNFVKN